VTRADIVAIVVAATLVGILYARLWQPPVDATRFEIRVAGQPVGRYPLDIDRSVIVDGRLGLSRIKVENGRVRFAASPCRNKICVHAGWLQHGGDAAACLPNRVSIALSGDAGAGLDAVGF
jgi:hypothetical protein